ncbi:Serine/threonine-protein kinase PknB [Bythopirellula goksoeyrii]|uniref:Serine/threonine-protein kinase PknB n=2 Tax=Bythopirellula goksoeyrii TaxID=1400387 RepID=A0A5B9QE32_9BACT|nr:Serine/threonine-protein kinase PknB [Bythopirellula goksoeyrii]
MDERCKTAHAKLHAGTCPWCGCFIIEGKVERLPADDDLSAHPIDSGDRQLAHTLEDHVRTDGVLSIEEAVGLLEAIAHELARLHKTTTMYGWLSPSNIGLQDGKIILRGPSIASESDDLPETTSGVTGIADYLAPEQALSASRTDHRADVYSLGCVLYFMLDGRAPFATGSISERLLKHQIEEPTPLGSIREGVPAGLAAICDRMLAKKAENRYQSAEDVILAIKSWKAEGP